MKAKSRSETAPTITVGATLIVQGLGDARTVTEQNIVGIGAEGTPQPVQNVDVIGVSHDAVNDLTTIILERDNDTGDTDDPVFSPIMTSLNIIGAYDSYSSPALPNGVLSYHGYQGRGFAVVNFSVVPEPATVGLLMLPAAMLGGTIRRRR